MTRSFTPTPEQLDIIEAAKSTNDNLLISALAGAAKTSTLVLIAEALAPKLILCLAFNKKIAEEMKSRLPPNCEAMTLNSLGHRVWGAAVQKRLVVNAKKNYEILRHRIDALSKRDKELAYEDFSEILKIIGQGKASGYIPTGYFSEAKAVMGDDDFFAALDEEPTALMEELIRDCSVESIRQGLKGTIDFDDQILLPTVFPASFPSYPVTLGDEGQDFSLLNHAMLAKIVRHNRLIVVGDECQSIYAFRGAHQDSMEILEQRFRMSRLVLSVSFRCPRKVVEEAQWRAPHMQYPDWAIEGEVVHKATWGVDELPVSPVILCRNNAPIFGMAIKLLKNGRYPEIVGNELGKSLLKTMKKFGPMEMPKAEVYDAIDRWVQEKLKKSRVEGKVHDQAECFRIFTDQGETLGDAIAYAEHIFSSQGPIRLMTIHKSKGLEFDHVYILDRGLIRVKEEQQEANLLYVAQTRAKSRLTYVTTEEFQDNG